MSISSDWEFLGATAECQRFELSGLDEWKHDWKDTKQKVHVKDPLYNEDFTFHVYEISTVDRIVAFAAGEF